MSQNQGNPGGDGEEKELIKINYNSNKNVVLRPPLFVTDYDDPGYQHSFI